MVQRHKVALFMVKDGGPEKDSARMSEEDREIPTSVGEVEVEIETIDEVQVEAQKEATELAVPTQILPNTLVVLPLG